MQNEEKELQNPHDTFFKHIFSDPNKVKALLSILFPQLFEHFTVNTIQHQPTEAFSVEDKQRLFFDVAVDCTLQQNPLKFYFIFEHKSYPDKRVILQFLRYILSVWEKDLKEGRELTAVIPVLFYNGKAQWSIPTDTAQYFRQLPEEIKQYLLRLQYLFFDIRMIDDEMTRQKIRQQQILMYELELMKLFATEAEKEEVLNTLIEYWEILRENLRDRASLILNLKMVIIYIQQTFKIESKEIKEKIEGKEVQEMKTLVDELIEEGFEKGVEKGIEKGLLIDAQEMVLSAIEAKLDWIPEGVEEKVKSINDVSYLRALLKRIIKSHDVIGLLKQEGLM
ncbi:Rpn family recombination-promoting nuclease/putative transposase [Thermodesulfovibrio hydrogeniphilus]